MIYADIIVDISNENIDKTFQYSIPTELDTLVHIGTRVDIPFGNRKGMTGYVTGLSSVPKIDKNKIKDITAISEKSVSIENRMVELAAWIRTNYGGTMNEALKTVLPVKKTVKAFVKREVVLKIPKDDAAIMLEEVKRKHYVAKARLLTELIDNPVLPLELVNTKLNIAQSTVKSLEKQGIVELRKESDETGDVILSCNPVLLNEEQKNACNTFVSDYEQKKRKVYLLHGITGSGKTEVYMEMINHVVQSGKKVIVLIPEISLTYQTVLRFKKRFGNKVAFFNSRLSDGERYDQYIKAKNGEIDIMIGPRSALFTPFENLGLIVVDEEHEGAYKSEGTPKYHARETAAQICKMSGAALVLGSATPSVESYKKALTGEYELLPLTKRAKPNAILPEVSVVDLREELKNKNRTIFSAELTNKMQERLNRKEQIMLFLNRRGYSGFVSCRSCGEAVKCPHCSVSLTQHGDGSLKCHYCGYMTKAISICPNCGSKYMAAFGTGTQKIEESVKKLFPSARVLRMDADTTKDKDSYERILSAFANEEADVLIGTQMIVKGHDFPKVTLVGILAADLSLYAGDYRASEKTFQLLCQAAGRAGRDNLKGDVVIQTYKPEHYAVQSAKNQDYKAFYNMEIAFRKMLKYPPEANIMALLFISKDETKVRKETEDVGKSIVDNFKHFLDNNELEIMGPTPAGLSKVNDYYRFIIYIKSCNYGLLTKISEQIENMKEDLKNSGISVQTDFNPMNTY